MCRSRWSKNEPVSRQQKHENASLSNDISESILDLSANAKLTRLRFLEIHVELLVTKQDKWIQYAFFLIDVDDRVVGLASTDTELDPPLTQGFHHYLHDSISRTLNIMAHRTVCSLEDFIPLLKEKWHCSLEV